MPRIAVAIFVVVAVSVSIGINIARYPAVFEMAGSTHESLVSDDTKEVSETKETEGTVAVNTMPALPDKDLAKWNPPMVSDVKPTVTEAVPHVASNNAYGEDAYAEENQTYSEHEPETAVAEESPNEESSASELNHYEVEPYRPYTSQPVEGRTEGEEQNTEEKRQEEATVAVRPEATYEDSAYEDNSAYENPAYDRYPSESDEETSQPSYRDETDDQEPSSSSSNSSLTWQAPSGTSSYSNVAPEHSAAPVNEMQSTGHWPATVAEVFRYKQEPDETSGKLSFYDKAPGDGYKSQAAIQEVSSSRSIPNGSPSSHGTTEVKKPLQQKGSTEIYEEKVEWEATAPLVAVHDRQPMNEDLPRTQIKRLPSIEGTEVLPGTLPSPETMAYPVVE